MWIYLKNNWVLFILKMSGSRGSSCIAISNKKRIYWRCDLSYENGENLPYKLRYFSNNLKKGNKFI